MTHMLQDMENFPNPQKNIQENTPTCRVEIESGLAEFVPREFLDDPVGYFEREGKNIKTGEIKYDESGIIREDPTAVKDLPIWKNAEGIEIQTVGKRVNTAKGAVGESNDPFYEYKILELLAQMGLPAAKPIAMAEQANIHIMVMEHIPGLRWSEKERLNLKERGYSDEDIIALMGEAERRMDELKTRFDEAGVVRGWKLKDMILQIDFEKKKVTSIMPTDWERTKIVEKL